MLAESSEKEQEKEVPTPAEAAPSEIQPVETRKFKGPCGRETRRSIKFHTRHQIHSNTIGQLLLFTLPRYLGTRHRTRKAGILPATLSRIQGHRNSIMDTHITYRATLSNLATCTPSICTNKAALSSSHIRKSCLASLTTNNKLTFSFRTVTQTNNQTSRSHMVIHISN